MKAFFMTPFIHKLRMWDRLAADRVDYFIANSKFTQKRIKKYYRRESDVIYSVGGNFVSQEQFDSVKKEDYYLTVGRLIGYKRFDLAIEACNKLGKRLVVIGTGNEEANLKKIAGPTIEFKGYCSDEEILEHYAKAKDINDRLDALYNCRATVIGCIVNDVHMPSDSVAGRGYFRKYGYGHYSTSR